MPLNAPARQARIELGLALISLPFLAETWVAHQTTPHPASPLMWTTPGGCAIACLAWAAWSHRRARRG